MKWRLWQILFASWALAIWIGSLIPLEHPVVPGGDKTQHLLGYAGLAFFAARAFQPGPRIWLGATLMGIAIELAQALTPWRSFEIKDMLANALGAWLGLMLALVWQYIEYRKHHHD